MSETTSRFLRALRNLALALINATLILAALCLFLGLRLADRVDAVLSKVAQNLVSVAPLREDVQGMTAEIAGLRGDISALRDNTGEMTSETAQAVTERLERFNARLDTVDQRMATLRERVASVNLNPEALIDHAIATASAELAASFATLAGCAMPKAGGMKAALQGSEAVAPPPAN